MPTPTPPAGAPPSVEGRRQRRAWLLHLFQARVKDLVARTLQDDSKDLAALMGGIVAILPSAWQHPESACARIVVGEQEFRTPNYRPTPWLQSAPFFTNDGARGLIEVGYLREFPDAAEGPFLPEERGLLNFLAEMFHGFIGRKLARQALLDARDELERRVQERTAELQALASQLSLTEERERRAIAEDLHDHIGQTLALAKIKLGGLVQSGALQPARAELDGLRELIEEAILYTRSLTFELSSPLLYELGLASAVEALAERLQARHGLPIEIEDDGAAKPLADETKVILFKAVRELLTNAVKHSGARRARVSLRGRAGALEVLVEDDGRGFDPDQPSPPGGPRGFGLLSIREGMRHCGGEFQVRSRPGRGVRAELRAPLLEASA